MYYFCMLGLGVIFIVLFLRIRAKKNNISALIFKVLSSVCFILSAAAAILYKTNVSSNQQIIQTKTPYEVIWYGLLITAGLIFGLFGDMWLDLKFIYPKDDFVYTFSGFISFGIGHFFFLAALSKFLYFPLKQIIFSLIVAAVFVVTVIVSEKALGLNYGKFKRISLLYAFVLSAMTAFAAFAAFIGVGTIKSAPGIVFIGGVFFIISDLILSSIYFGKDKNTPFNIITNHITYYIAQFLIASSILFL